MGCPSRTAAPEGAKRRTGKEVRPGLDFARSDQVVLIITRLPSRRSVPGPRPVQPTTPSTAPVRPAASVRVSRSLPATATLRTSARLRPATSLRLVSPAATAAAARLRWIPGPLRRARLRRPAPGPAPEHVPTTRRPGPGAEPVDPHLLGAAPALVLCRDHGPQPVGRARLRAPAAAHARVRRVVVSRRRRLCGPPAAWAPTVGWRGVPWAGGVRGGDDQEAREPRQAQYDAWCRGWAGGWCHRRGCDCRGTAYVSAS